MSSEETTGGNPESIRRQIFAAISNPGRYLKRREDEYEYVSHWSTRAVMKVLKDWLAGRVVVDLPEPQEGDFGWLPAGVGVVALLQHGSPRVAMDFAVYEVDWPADIARQLAAALLAAADASERLSVPGSSGEAQ